ncbi:MAG: murein biosynthesis integral membrane protein MurJ [Kiritimatiellia bacterium]|nr:murein biosynthesis integral membrane protein MurJ [Kiritimatiellia bacterium]
MKRSQGNAVLRHAGIISLMTAISRIGGLGRELLMAYLFGTSSLQSAFVVAFRLPNLFRRLFGEGALTNAFIPVFSETLLKEGKESATRFAGMVAGLQSIVLAVLVASAIAVSLLVESWLPDGSRWVQILFLARIMLPYALLICQTAILSGMLNSVDRFTIPSLTPCVLNIVWGAALIICPFISKDELIRIQFVSYAILLAGVVQLLFQLPELHRAGLRLRPCYAFRRALAQPKVRQVLTLLAPTILGSGLDQINMCLDGVLAFHAEPWAPAALEYADRIAYLPLGMFSTAFATVLLPVYSRAAALNDFQAIRSALSENLRHLSLITAPVLMAMTLLPWHLTDAVYVWPDGKFAADSLYYTGLAVLAFAPGMFVFSAQKCVTPIFFALKDSRTPMKISIACIGLNLSLNLVSVFLLPSPFKHVGLTLSTVLCSLVNVLISTRILNRRHALISWHAILPTALKATLCAFLSVGAAWLLLQTASTDCAKLARLLWLAVAGAFAALLYIALLRFAMPQDFQAFQVALQSIRNRRTPSQ